MPDTRSRSEDAGSRDARERSPDAADRSAEATLDRTIEEGRDRLTRGWAPLLSTGFVGGLDVGTGVLALLLVEHETGSKALGGLAFGVGFIALTMARSELFTEDFLVPVTTVIAKESRWRALGRLWLGTLVANLAGGWLVTLLVVQGFPQLRGTALELGTFYGTLGLGVRSAALGLLGGLAITLMTYMQHTTESLGAKLIAAVSTAFVLGAGSLNHAIVSSLLMFAALHTGEASFGYLDYAGAAAWAALWNCVGGVGLVTLLRLLQTPEQVQQERANPST